MADQYERTTVLHARTHHHHVDVFEQRVKPWSVTALATTAAVAPLIHGVDRGAERRKPGGQVLIPAAVLAQPVHDHEGPSVRHRVRLPSSNLQTQPIRRL